MQPEVLTYGELNRRSNEVARWLVSLLNGGKEERVCVCRQRDAWFYVVQAAIWKAGACYVAVSLSSFFNRHFTSGSTRFCFVLLT